MADGDFTLRKCCVCHEFKPRDSFGPRKKSSDGLQYECRTCVLAKVKAYMAAGGEAYKAKKRAYDRERVARKREELAKQARARYAKKRQEIMAKVKAWNIANPERTKSTRNAYKHRRRAVEKSGDTTATIHAWEMAAAKVCYWCGRACADKYHVDHYQPLSKGGLHAVANLVIACPKCNQAKSAKDPYQFANELGRLF
jgi:5-methylcytosine-specific restriction endonuclease McrA